MRAASPARISHAVHVQGSVSPAIERHPIHTSIVQRLPRVERAIVTTCRSFPPAIERFDLDGYDLVISTSHCAAKAVVDAARARHLCYCFTPMRYAWDQFDAYFGPSAVGPPPSRALQAGAARGWRAGTRATAGRVRPLCGYLTLCCGPDPPIL